MTGAPHLALPLLLALLVGCVEGPGLSDLPRGDAQAFADEVQPILGPGCANPACHGSEQRPLELYATGLHRADPADLYSDAPLHDLELERNQRAAEAMLAGLEAAADSPLLTKPLSPDHGGSEHRGGVQFVDPSELDYLTLLDWAEAALLESP